MVLLDLGDLSLLRRHRDQSVARCLLVTDGFVLRRQVAIQPPVVFATLLLEIGRAIQDLQQSLAPATGDSRSRPPEHSGPHTRCGPVFSPALHN